MSNIKQMVLDCIKDDFVPSKEICKKCNITSSELNNLLNRMSEYTIAEEHIDGKHKAYKLMNRGDYE